MELVSICIPTYNGEKYLKECIDSAINQTYPHTEIIIVDDCSNDSTIKIINEYHDDRIKLFMNDSNLGLVANWNKCIEHATSEWIKFLFQDDFLELNCIKEMMLYAADAEMIVCERKYIFESVSPAVKILYDNTIRLTDIFNVNGPTLLSPGQISTAINKHVNRNFIGEPTSVLFKKSCCINYGNFNTLLKQLCDFEYWARVGTNSGIMYLPVILSNFRIHNKSMSAVNRHNAVNVADIAVLIACYLYSASFIKFRSYQSNFHILRLKLILKLRIYESNILISQGESDLTGTINALCNEYPSACRSKIPGEKIFFSFMKIKRYIYK
jgi:glycosyltransferase involved in cell wall biosynthesis